MPKPSGAPSNPFAVNSASPPPSPFGDSFKYGLASGASGANGADNSSIIKQLMSNIGNFGQMGSVTPNNTGIMSPINKSVTDAVAPTLPLPETQQSPATLPLPEAQTSSIDPNMGVDIGTPIANTPSTGNYTAVGTGNMAQTPVPTAPGQSQSFTSTAATKPPDPNLLGKIMGIRSNTANYGGASA